MSDKIYIYGLSGYDNIIRYIGKSYRPIIRKNDHICEAKRGIITHKNNWIRKVLNNNEELKIHIIEECNEDNWVEREKYWIGQIPNLTNLSKGGEGSSYSKYESTLVEMKEWVLNNIPNINSEKKWRKWIKLGELPECFPKRPDSVYKNRDWKNWTDFFNNNSFLSYNELKEIVIKEKIKNIEEYRIFRKNKMPYNPAQYYKGKGWESWYSFLNTKPKINKKKLIIKKNKIKLINYSEAKLIIKDLKLTTKSEYTNWYLENKNLGLPRNPINVYKNEWISYNDFFGNDLPKNIKYIGKKKITHFLSYKDSKEWVNKNCDIKSESIWRTLTKNLPSYIPKRPDYVYKYNGWESWNQFLN
jgi:hypothetical protein